MSFDIQHGEIQSKENLPIRYSYYPREDSAPVLIFVHGFKGFKDWGAFPRACAFLNKQGFAVLAINLSRNGVGESLTDFDELDLFADQTLSSDLDDVLTVVDYLRTNTEEFPGADTDRIGIIGHSRGGHTVIAAAAETENIKALATWSAVANYNRRWSDEMIADWEEKGYTEILNGRTKQWMRINKKVWDDAKENADRLMADKRVKELSIPALFVHGNDDPAVAPSNADTLYKACGSVFKEIIRVDGAGHTYETAHPDDPDQPLPEEFRYMLAQTARHFQEAFHVLPSER